MFIHSKSSFHTLFIALTCLFSIFNLTSCTQGKISESQGKAIITLTAGGKSYKGVHSMLNKATFKKYKLRYNSDKKDLNMFRIDASFQGDEQVRLTLDILMRGQLKKGTASSAVRYRKIHDVRFNEGIANLVPITCANFTKTDKQDNSLLYISIKDKGQLAIKHIQMGKHHPPKYGMGGYTEATISGTFTYEMREDDSGKNIVIKGKFDQLPYDIYDETK